MDSLEFALDREIQRKISKRDDSVIKEALIWQKKVKNSVFGLNNGNLIDVPIITNNESGLLQRVYLLGTDDSLKVDTLNGFKKFMNINFSYKPIASGVYYEYNSNEGVYFQAKAPSCDNNQLGYIMYTRDFKLDSSSYQRIFLPLTCVIVPNSDFKNVKNGNMLIESFNNSTSNPDFFTS